jgi:hypothetical protein
MQLKNPPVNEEPQQEMKIEINNEE